MKDEYKMLFALFLLFCLLTIKIKEGNCTESPFGQCENNGCKTNNNTKRCIDQPICSQLNNLFSRDSKNYLQCKKNDLCVWNNGECMDDLCATYGSDVCPKDKCKLIKNWCVFNK